LRRARQAIADARQRRVKRQPERRKEAPAARRKGEINRLPRRGAVGDA
jgi:hypothetical protein